VRFAFGIIVATLVFGGACGYRVAGTAGRGLPPGVRTIAVPAFENQTLGFRIDQTLTAAVIHELTTRAAYRVQSGPEGSDATLHGSRPSTTRSRSWTRMPASVDRSSSPAWPG
jgi:hypothetical protein